MYSHRSEAGRDVYRSKVVYGTERAAKHALSAFEAHVHTTDPADTTTPPEAFTVGDMLDRYQTSRSSGWSPSTIRDLRSLRKLHLKTLEPLDAATLRPIDVQDFLDGLAAKPATARYCRAVLRSAWEDAAALELVPDRNPARRVRLPTAPKRTATAPTLDRVAPAIAATIESDPAMATLIRVAAITGARRGELLALRWRDLDVKTGVVRVTHAVASDGHELVLKGTKAGTTKTVAIDPVTVAMLQSWRARCREDGLVQGVRIGAGSFVWSQEQQGVTPWWPDTVSKRWRQIADASGLVGVRFHDLRHCMVTTLQESRRFDARNIADRAGHTTAMTLDVYSHGSEEIDRAQAEYLAAILDGTGS